MIKSVQHKVDFDLDTFIKEELPITYNFFDGEFNKEYREDLEGLFSYVSENKASMPFYEVSGHAAYNLTNSCEQMYKAMHDALEFLFHEDDLELAVNFFGETLRQFPYFYEYAKKTYERSHPAMYGRFDVSMTKEGEVKGIYEFNGDTPVMLFESTSLQNYLVDQVTSTDNQINNYYPAMVERINKFLPSGSVAVILDYNYIEDICTCETIKQIFEEAGRTVYLGTIDDLEYDYNSYGNPFRLNEVAVDNLFMLCPWEEMLEKDIDGIIKGHDKWINDVKFLEPAWRWFFANKGMYAFLTFLAENYTEFEWVTDIEGFLPTYLTPEEFLEQKVPYVGKPLTGRLSSNILFFDEEGNIEYESEGGYGEDDYIYQMMCTPDQVEEDIITWLEDQGYNVEER